MRMRLSEVAYFVDDVPAAVSFYRALLGEPEHKGTGIAIFRAGDAKLLIHERYEPKTPKDLPCEDHVAFAVEDLEATLAELRTQGISIEREPHVFPWGKSAYLRTPAGKLVELEESPRRDESH